MKRKKITVVGSGNTGAETALLLAAKNLGDLVLLGTPRSENQTVGKALDILQAATIFGSDINIQGTSSYQETMDSDLVIITAGVARKPGMSREDLIDINVKVVSEVVEQTVKYSPNASFLILTNPVDVMTYVAYKVSGLPKNKIIGQAGVLDTARYRTFIAQELGVSVNDVSAFVLGVHGDEMVPLTRYTFVKGLPMDQLLTEEQIKRIIQRTRKGGAEIVSLLGTGSAYFAPAASLVEMAESILLDRKSIMTGVTYLEGEYGYSDLVLGVPLVIGANGVERILELNLLPEEKANLERSAAAVQRGLRNVMNKEIRMLA